MAMKLSLVSLSLLVFLSVFNTTSYADICPFINCAQGTCRPTALLGFECDCHPGWTKLKIGSFEWPTCLLPNCTINFDCNLAPPPGAPAPIPPFIPPSLLDIFKPCGLVWCGLGECVEEAGGYSCQCDEGSANLMGTSSLPCFKKCHIGADCNGFRFDVPLLPP